MAQNSHLEHTATRVLDFIDRHREAPLGIEAAPTDEFDRVALEVFDFQYQHSAIYRAFCDRRNRTPDRIENWRQIPSVPTSAFKSLELSCAPAQKTFLTSGTTQGKHERGRHHVPRLELYRRSAMAHFARMVLPDGVRPTLVGLLAGPDLLVDSSLAQMVDWIREEFCDGEGTYLVGPEGFDPAKAVAHITQVASEGRPLCLIGVRVVWTALLEYCAQQNRSLEIPPDSRIVDTGGPKGGRALSDAGFLAATWKRLGVAGYYCVNEYGMTELCSQYYDDVLAERFRGSNRKRRKVGPAWLRPQIVDPATLNPLPEGETGLLCHFDLANALSVFAVQTEDLGVVEEGRIRLLGRAPGAEPRGCALALADLLAVNP